MELILRSFPRPMDNCRGTCQSGRSAQQVTHRMLTECASEGVCRGETANLLEGCPRLGIGRDITDQQPFFLGPRICPSVHILGGWPRRGAWDIIECRSLIFWNPASTSDQHVLVMVRKRTGDDVHRTLDEMTTAGWSAGMNGVFVDSNLRPPPPPSPMTEPSCVRIMESAR